MTDTWLEMRLSVPDEAVDLVAQILVDLGSTGIIAADKPLDTFTVPPPDTLANDPTLRAYFLPNDPTDKLCETIRSQLVEHEHIYPGLSSLQIDYKLIDGMDWANDWKQHFPAFRVGERLIICPS